MERLSRNDFREELSRAVAFVHSSPAEAVRKKISELKSKISHHEDAIRAEEDSYREWCENRSPDDWEAEFPYELEGPRYKQELEKASLECEALTAAAKLLEGDTATASAEEALRTVLAGFEVRTAKEREELERLLEEYRPLHRLVSLSASASGRNPQPLKVGSFLSRLDKLGEWMRSVLLTGRK